ncbi:YraN family protein [Paenibacillus sp. 2TAB23]|uniref:YraN family protein n=1 Tax=Paenibacillus sp. 2TAB23 TaxID=3233004 RepID=UPI003F98C1CD
MAEEITSVGKQSSNDQRKQTGERGEQAAYAYLSKANYTILERNWRCRSGEIDIIAEYDGRLIFVEVRTRTASGKFGSAAESVDYRKQQKVRNTAQVYLKSMGRLDAAQRFDVIAVSINRKNAEVEDCRHFEGAF